MSKYGNMEGEILNGDISNYTGWENLCIKVNDIEGLKFAAENSVNKVKIKGDEYPLTSIKYVNGVQVNTNEELVQIIDKEVEDKNLVDAAVKVSQIYAEIYKNHTINIHVEKLGKNKVVEL
jgi:hypothetical protein